MIELELCKADETIQLWHTAVIFAALKHGWFPEKVKDAFRSHGIFELTLSEINAAILFLTQKFPGEYYIKEEK